MVHFVRVLAWAGAALVGVAEAESASTSLAAEYAAFRQKHGSQEKMSSSVYKARLAKFAQTKAEVEAHNARPGMSWKLGLNKFSDRLDHEFKGMLGYKRTGSWWLRNENSYNRSSSFLQVKRRKIQSFVDWRNSLSTGSRVVDQGGCGSCWAVAASGALEMYAQKSSGLDVVPLSFKGLLDCVPNPQHCGGTGGCQGATATLAYEYVKDHGIPAQSQYWGNNELTETCQQDKAKLATVKTTGFVQLPTNKLQPLMDALSNEGPVSVSLAAGEWRSYSSGVFAGCVPDAIISHAVLAVGYGTDSGHDYFLIRNSWGQDWGENGFIRIKRFSSDDGKDGHCGTDVDPKQGNGCDGGPSTIPVCGMCGMLSDSNYPTGVSVQ
eukprot:TRINITY_DN3213_c0_g1_i1.p1 TRINITY_DN3213_c0_g1~~TRINITY_DN3213_c0_g1_i1.p1  ORF type:complete len:379 (+),score=58.32 TRINITY_DN3213_c0_g1_i1:82-1218(+)